MNFAQVLKGAPLGNQNAAGPHKHSVVSEEHSTKIVGSSDSQLHALVNAHDSAGLSGNHYDAAKAELADRAAVAKAKANEAQSAAVAQGVKVSSALVGVKEKLPYANNRVYSVHGRGVSMESTNGKSLSDSSVKEAANLVNKQLVGLGLRVASVRNRGFEAHIEVASSTGQAPYDFRGRG